jgi:hypothetical protein
LPDESSICPEVSSICQSAAFSSTAHAGEAIEAISMPDTITNTETLTLLTLLPLLGLESLSHEMYTYKCMRMRGRGDVPQGTPGGKVRRITLPRTPVNNGLEGKMERLVSVESTQ